RGPDPAFALLCADSSWERVGEVGKPHSQLPSRCFLWPRSVSPARADSSWEMRSQLPSSHPSLLRRTPQIQVGNGAAHLGLPNLIFSISVKVLTAPASCGGETHPLRGWRRARLAPLSNTTPEGLRARAAVLGAGARDPPVLIDGARDPPVLIDGARSGRRRPAPA